MNRITEHCRTAYFTLRKFHTVKIWYLFLTAREKLVHIRHVIHTNISLFCEICTRRKFYVAYMRILRIDNIPPPPLICPILQSIQNLHRHGMIL